MPNETDSVPQALRTYVNDMVTLDKHILEAVERQYEDERTKDNARVRDLLAKIKNAQGRHVAALEGHVTRLGSEAGAAVKQAVGSAAGVVAGLYDKVRKDPVSRMLRDDYTALNLAAISYIMLHTTALAFRNQAVADTALSHLQDLTPIIMGLNAVVPYVVAEELTDDGSVDPSAAPTAVENTQRAWKW
jgi:hypothetical protein